MAVKKKSGLGKGLDAIFAENDTEANSSSTVMLRLDEIEPNREQPRKEFNEESFGIFNRACRFHCSAWSNTAVIGTTSHGWRIPNCSG